MVVVVNEARRAALATELEVGGSQWSGALHYSTVTVRLNVDEA